MIEAKILKGDRLVFQSVANTKQEVESDLLYQLMNYFDFSIHINPDFIPTVKERFSKSIEDKPKANPDTVAKGTKLEDLF
tara:strand:+ start:1104 stop:1343 length:240 start_codon:yes stop_codon:yes gene_type:complete